MPICKFFAQGRCTWGGSCKNSHEATTAALETANLPRTFAGETVETFQVNQQTTRLPNVVCIHYLKGKCLYGARCRNLHEAEERDKPRSRGWNPSAAEFTLPSAFFPVLPMNESPIVNELCSFFAKGFCRNGDTCRFLHGKSEFDRKQEDELNRKNANELFPKLIADLSIATGSLLKEFNGAVVTFNERAEVEDIKLPSDFSAVQISGLPAGSNVRAVVKFLADIGFEAPESSIFLKQLGDAGAIAEVKMADPSFARRLVRDFQYHMPQSPITIRSVSSIGSPETLGSRMQLSKVTCRWYMGSQMAWLVYKSRNSATSAMRKLESSAMHQRTLTCKLQTSNEIVLGFVGPKFTLIITNLHPKTTSDDLRHLLRRCVPDQISMKGASKTDSNEESAAAVEELLGNKGQLESFSYTCVEGTNKMNATATFANRESAADAVLCFNNIRIPRHGTTTLSLRQVVSIKYNVRTNIVKALEQQLDSLTADIWNQAYIKLQVFPQTDPHKTFTALRLLGNEFKKVAVAKLKLEKLLSGHIVLDSDTVLWDPYFLTPDAIAYLNHISSINQVYVHRDSRKSQLVLHGGSVESKQQIQTILVEKVKSVRRSEQLIILDSGLLYQAMHGGMRKLKERFGASAKLNVAHQPRTISISGTKEDFEEALSLLNGDTTSQFPIAVHDNEDCAVCWVDATQALNTACGHVYCKECFSHQISAVGENDIPVICAKENCTHVFTLNELKRMLSEDKLERFLRLVFDIFTRTKPKDFRHCPTPDCPQLYRPTGSGDIFLCSICLASTCTTCNVVSHDGMTCAEYRDLSSDGAQAFQKWMIESDARSCPSCKIVIQKTEGCNHMTCSNCSAHICWFCMEVFKTGPGCYGHMQAVHGSYM